MIERIEEMPAGTIGLRASGGAWIEDFKIGLGAWFRDHSAWKRFAFVTDVEWLAKAMRMFSWMAPGEVKVCGLVEAEEAKRWVAG